MTHLIVEEDGPSELVVRLRLRAGNGQLGALMDCFYCTSVWVAAPLALKLSPRPRELPLTWLALSGAACLLEQATAPRKPTHDTREARQWDAVETSEQLHEAG